MAPFSPFFDVLCDTNVPDLTHVCELAVPREWHVEQPEVSLLQLSQSCTDGCPACRLNLQALLVSIPELKRSLRDPVILESIRISPKGSRSPETDSFVSYRVDSHGPLKLLRADGFRIFTTGGKYVSL